MLTTDIVLHMLKELEGLAAKWDELFKQIEGAQMSKVFAPPHLVLIIPVEKQKSVIYVNDDDELPTQGTVVSVGDAVDGNWLDKEVIFKKFSTQAFEFDDIKYLAVDVKDVVAVLQD